MKTLVFTGGHHTSALEVAKTLKNKGWDIVWFGHRHSMWADKAVSAEYTEVTSAGIKFYDLLAGKFYRTFNPLKLIRIPWGFIQAFIWLARIRPAGIVSFGGYLAVPTVISGWILGIPAITHEQTVIQGWANKLISLFARKIAVTWPASLAHYPKDKAVLTGLPLREEIKKIKNLKLKIENLVYITGGKQGAQVINKVVFAALPQLLKKYHVIHQTGNLDIAQAQSRNQPGYACFAYDSSKAISALSKAEVVVSRGGAHSIYELGYLGKKCVIIPIPWVSHNEQYLNAQILVQNNQAVILPQSELSVTTLLSSIKLASQLNPQPLKLPANSSQTLVQLIEQEFT